MTPNWNNRIATTEGCFYCGITRDKFLSFPLPKRSFRVVLYGAFNAFGLIGPENNGIAIFDNDNRQVLLDQHCQQDTGYFGPSTEQFKEWDRLLQMSWKEFRSFVNSHSRTRFEI